MVKTRGNLNKQELDQLEQAKLVKTEPVNHGITTKTTRKWKARPRIKPSAHKVMIILALILLIGGAGMGLYLGTLPMGVVAVDELTAVQVVLNINSNPQTILTNASTIEELLNEQRILLDETDYLGQELDHPLHDGMTVWLRLSVPISILADGQIYTLESQPITVQEALDRVGVELGPDDYTTLPLLQYIYTATDIEVRRVRMETVIENEPIEPLEVQQEFTYLAPGSTTVISEGRDGVRQVTYAVTYENDVEVSRRELDSVVLNEPGDRVIGVGPSTSAVLAGVDADGTPTVHTATTEDGATFYYTEQFVVETTAYTWTGNTTFTGTWPKQGTIAVDPDVIPLGTQVYIVGYGFATAEDTGGAIDGEIVDLYMDTEEACIAWGRRDAVVYILAE